MKILVATDGSELSKKALDVAKKIGISDKAQITIITVATEVKAIEIEPSTNEFVKEVERRKSLYCKKILEIAMKCFEDYPYKVNLVSKDGNAAVEITQYADENDIDLIVMGSRGLGAVSRFMIGSVSTRVLNHSSKSVYIVK